MDLAPVFDGSGQVRRPPYHRLLAEFWSLLAYHPAPPAAEELPSGQGRAVLVIPAFLTSDGFTRGLRDVLTRCGFRAFGWELGINWGPTPALLSGLRRRLLTLHRREAAPVALVGISLGGLFARDLAYDYPEAVRHVVTLASPFRLPTACTIEPLFRLLASRYSPDVQVARLQQPLPVPSTAIYTRDDGIVDWRSCRMDEADGRSIELRGAHTTLCRDPEALRCVVWSLAGD